MDLTKRELNRVAQKMRLKTLKYVFFLIQKLPSSALRDVTCPGLTESGIFRFVLNDVYKLLLLLLHYGELR